MSADTAAGLAAPPGLAPVSSGVQRDWSSWIRPAPDGGARLELAVDGISCAACMGDIERAMSGLPGVTAARVNLTDRRLSVSFNPALAEPDRIIEKLAAMGHPARPFDPALRQSTASAEMRRLLTCLAVAGFAATNVMLLSIAVWSGNVTDITPETRDFFHAVSALIALPAIAIAGRPFFVNALRTLRGGSITVDLPIAVGVTLATAYSFFNTVTHAREAYFDSALMLLFFLLVGRTLDETMRRRTAIEAETLAALRADAAVRIAADGTLHEVPVSAVVPGDMILVRPGDRIPVDGIVVEGASDIDASLVTGETTPVPAFAGTLLYAGTANGAGALTIRAEKAEAGSFLDEVERLLNAAGDARSKERRLADRVTRAYTPVVHIAALATFIGWIAVGAGWRPALADAIAVLIITCPCALALAIPAVQVVTAGLLFRQRILLQTGDAIERLAAVDTIVFDKTGTLTLPCQDIVNAGDYGPGLLGRAGGLAALSRHPLAGALARAVGAAPLLSAGIHEVPGAGIEAEIEGQTVRLGRPSFCGVESGRLAAFTARFPNASFVAYAEGNETPAIFALAQQLRPGAAATIAALKKAGYAVEILSGDHAPAVAGTAKQLGIETWQANLKPAGKIAHLHDLEARGAKVLMVGDGLNDAPALRAAHASMSPVTGSRLTQTAADAVFLGDNLDAVRYALAVSRRARHTMTQNLVFALAYNAAAIPIAILGHASPLVAALAMSSSSIVVTLNALRLRLGARHLIRDQSIPVPPHFAPEISST
jgi:Cu2+-exporting ATPase